MARDELVWTRGRACSLPTAMRPNWSALLWVGWAVTCLVCGSPTTLGVQQPASANSRATSLASAAAVVRLPELTVNIPADYAFRDGYYLSVGGSANVFVQIEEPGPGFAADLEDEHHEGGAPCMAVLRDLAVLSQDCVDDGCDAAVDTVVAASDAKTAAHNDRFPSLCTRDLQHALKFTVDSDSKQRRVLVLLRDGDREWDVVRNASALLRA